MVGVVQAWAAELADKESGGMVNGFPSRITTVEELVELVATIIMQVTAVHCAVNFLQCAPLPVSPSAPIVSTPCCLSIQIVEQKC